MLRLLGKHLHVDIYEMSSIVMNSIFNETIINDNKRLIVWSPGRIHTFSIADRNMLTESGAFLARKFDMSLDSQIVGKTEEQLAARGGIAFGSLS